MAEPRPIAGARFTQIAVLFSDGLNANAVVDRDGLALAWPILRRQQRTREECVEADETDG